MWLLDRQLTNCEQAMEWIRRQSAQEASASETDTREWISQIQVVPPLATLQQDKDLLDALPIDLVLECVPEQMSLKRRVLRQISDLFPAPVVIASNSSYFLPSLLAKYVESPSRYAHFHFHVPVSNDSIADIVGAPDTQPLVIEQLETLSKKIGQEPVVLRREHPGYVFNWMLQSLLKSALELAALDVADPEVIDKSWKAVTRMPLGPFGIMDQIGLDVIEQVLANARWTDGAHGRATDEGTAGKSSVGGQASASETPATSTDQLLQLLREYTEQGYLGTKAGRGFYTYDGSPASTGDGSDPTV